ncbi:RuvB-like protein 2 [Tanacetum coccineum]
MAPIVVVSTNRGITTIRGSLSQFSSSTHNHTQKTTFPRIKRMIDVDISDDAKVLLTKIGVETSLRYATNLITSAALACQKRKGKVMEMDDVGRVYELFWDVKRSTQYLIKYQAATEEEDESNMIQKQKQNQLIMSDATFSPGQYMAIVGLYVYAECCVGDNSSSSNV